MIPLLLKFDSDRVAATQVTAVERMGALMEFQNVLIYAGAAVVLLLVFLIAMLIARSSSGGVRGRRGQRLAVTEYHDIDKIRRLVLIRRDRVEHLVLIGPHHDMVIESGIGAQAELPLGDEAPYLRPPQHLEPPADNTERGEPPPLRARMPPRPAVFGDRAPNLRSMEPDGPRLSSVGNYEEPDGR
jgi:flagellar protein FliO/FliZ